MTKEGLRVALRVCQDLPAFPSLSEATQWYRQRRDDLHDRLALAVEASGLSLHDTFEFLDQLESWSHSVWGTNRLRSQGLTAGELADALMLHAYRVCVVCFGASWVVKESDFAPGHYDLGVQQGLLTLMMPPPNSAIAAAVPTFWRCPPDSRPRALSGRISFMRDHFDPVSYGRVFAVRDRLSPDPHRRRTEEALAIGGFDAWNENDLLKAFVALCSPLPSRHDLKALLIDKAICGPKTCAALRLWCISNPGDTPLVAQIVSAHEGTAATDLCVASVRVSHSAPATFRVLANCGDASAIGPSCEYMHDLTRRKRRHAEQLVFLFAGLYWARMGVESPQIRQIIDVLAKRAARLHPVEKAALHLALPIAWPLEQTELLQEPEVMYLSRVIATGRPYDLPAPRGVAFID